METSINGIQIHKGHIFVPGDSKLGIKALTVREHSLNAYAQFVKAWSLGAARSVDYPQGTLTSLWVLDASFREAMTEALGHLGIVEPGTLKVTHLMELLLVCNVEGSQDSRPALFRLHSDMVDPKLLGQVQGTAPRNLPSSQRLGGFGTWLAKFSKTQA